MVLNLWIEILHGSFFKRVMLCFNLEVFRFLHLHEPKEVLKWHAARIVRKWISMNKIVQVNFGAESIESITLAPIHLVVILSNGDTTVAVGGVI